MLQNKVIDQVDVQINHFTFEPEYKFSDDGKLLAALFQIAGDGFAIEIYNTTTGLRIIRIPDEREKREYISFDIHSYTNKIFIASKLLSGEVSLSVFNFNDANLIFEKNVSGIKLSERERSKVYFSPDGQLVAIINSDEKHLSILNVSDLQPAQGTKLENVYIGNSTNGFSKSIIYWIDGNDVKFWHISKGEPISLKNVKLGDKDTISSDADMQRAVIWGPQRSFELWDLKEKKLLRQLTSSKDKHIQSVAFSMNDTAVVITEEGNIASLFDAKDGTPLAQHIPAASVYYYDPELRRIHAWNSSGQVLRYVEGRSYFGKFVPTKTGAQD